MKYCMEPRGQTSEPWSCMASCAAIWGAICSVSDCCRLLSAAEMLAAAAKWLCCWNCGKLLNRPFENAGPPSTPFPYMVVNDC